MSQRLITILLMALTIGATVILATSVGFTPQSSTAEPASLEVTLSDSDVLQDTQQKSPLPVPTRADGKPQRSKGFVAVPLSEEKLYIGSPVEVESLITPEPSPQFNVKNEYVIVKENFQVFTLYVQDLQTNNSIRLGDDSGSAVYAASDDRYVIWGFICEPQCQTLKQGMYAYDSMSSEQTYISEKYSALAYPRLDKPWLIYIYTTDPQIWRGSLYAYNLETHEHFLLASGIPDTRQTPTKNYIGINDEQAYWVDSVPFNEPSLIVHVFNFSTRVEKQLKIPDLMFPQLTAIFGNYFVWFDEFWQGYRLQDDAYFTIPVVPPGWDATQVRGAEVIDISDDHIFWRIESADKSSYYTAPILDKEISTGQ